MRPPQGMTNGLPPPHRPPMPGAPGSAPMGYQSGPTTYGAPPTSMGGPPPTTAPLGTPAASAPAPASSASSPQGPSDPNLVFGGEEDLSMEVRGRVCNCLHLRLFAKRLFLLLTTLACSYAITRNAGRCYVDMRWPRETASSILH